MEPKDRFSQASLSWKEQKRLYEMEIRELLKTGEYQRRALLIKELETWLGKNPRRTREARKRLKSVSRVHPKTSAEDKHALFGRKGDWILPEQKYRTARASLEDIYLPNLSETFPGNRTLPREATEEGQTTAMVASAGEHTLKGFKSQAGVSREGHVAVASSDPVHRMIWRKLMRFLRRNE